MSFHVTARRACRDGIILATTGGGLLRPAAATGP
jgi:hypothetical protein